MNTFGLILVIFYLTISVGFLTLGREDTKHYRSKFGHKYYKSSGNRRG